MYLDSLHAWGEPFILLFSHREFDCIQAPQLGNSATFGKADIKEESVKSRPTWSGSLNVAWGGFHHLFTAKEERRGCLPSPSGTSSICEFITLEYERIDFSMFVLIFKKFLCCFDSFSIFISINTHPIRF